MEGNSSKELLYSEYAGTSVVEHVLDTLGKKTNKSLRQRIDESFKKKEKSETFERVRKLMSLIEKEQDASNTAIENPKENCIESLDTENERIEVVMEVDENSPKSNIDAWFLCKLSKEQEPKCSDDDEFEQNSPARKILDLSDSSDTSDDELEHNFPVIVNGFALNGTDSSNSSSNESDKNEVKSFQPTKIKNNLNFLVHNSSDTSRDELQQNFPIITNGFMFNGNDSSNSSNDFPPSSLKIKNYPKFDNDDDSNSSDVKNKQCLSVNNVKNNQNSEISGTLQISLPVKNDKKVFEIPNESSEYLNHEFTKPPSVSVNIENLSSEKKMSNFVLKDSSNYSFDECEQNDGANKMQKHIVENDSDSSNVVLDDFASRREKSNVLENVSTKHLDDKTVEFISKRSLAQKRKLCIEDTCDIENTKKKITLLD